MQRTSVALQKKIIEYAAWCVQVMLTLKGQFYKRKGRGAALCPPPPFSPILSNGKGLVFRGPSFF